MKWIFTKVSQNNKRSRTSSNLKQTVLKEVKLFHQVNYVLKVQRSSPSNSHFQHVLRRIQVILTMIIISICMVCNASNHRKIQFERASGGYLLHTDQGRVNLKVKSGCSRLCPAKFQKSLKDGDKTATPSTSSDTEFSLKFFHIIFNRYYHCPNLQALVHNFSLCLQGEKVVLSRLHLLLAHPMHQPPNHSQLSSAIPAAFEGKEEQNWTQHFRDSPVSAREQETTTSHDLLATILLMPPG